MKHVRKLASCLLAFVMVFAMATTAFAQDVSIGDGNGSITISNAARDVTYKIYKLFDATVTGTEDGPIAYTGTIPTELTDYFERDAAGNITATTDAWSDPTTKAEMSEGLRNALTAWVEREDVTPTEYATSDGTVLNFKNLAYGYYVVTTTQGDQTISVNSTNPNAEIFDKNETRPGYLHKTADDTDVNIGDTVTYTVTFKAANYEGEGDSAKKITSYIITDTLPSFLQKVRVTSIIVDNDGDANTTNDHTDVTAQFDGNKTITIDWYDEENDRLLYGNSATVTIVYTAEVTDAAEIDGGGNENEVTVSWTLKNGEGEPDTPSTRDPLTDTEQIYTYAIALQKVNEQGRPLAGAEFGFTFYVNKIADADGAYIYAGTNPGDGLTNTLTTPDNGLIVIKGVEIGDSTDAYTITEVTAPNGYNMLTDPIVVKPVKTSTTTTNKTFYLNENGEVVTDATETVVNVIIDNIAATPVLVVNNTGTELPSTGGMGTTLFYVVGGILVAGAVVLLVAKKRMASKN